MAKDLIMVNVYDRTAPVRDEVPDSRNKVWDEELSRIVQAWINQCIFQHDCGKCRETSRFGVGQNLYSAGDFKLKPVDWNRPLNAFFDEVDMMDKSEVDSFLGNRGVGHYTQLVWGATSHVGCGYIAYKNNRYIQSYYACNYGQAGNYVNRKIYSVGPACSKCPDGASCSNKFEALARWVEEVERRDSVVWEPM
nr:CRISP/Allergen/PR-1-like [Penaeus vannamei]